MNKSRNTRTAIIVVVSMIVTMGATTLSSPLQLQQANAASLRQHSNLLNNCFRPDLCRQSNVDQGTAGNDNQATGFGDLSNNANTPTTNPTVGAPGPAGPAGPKGDQGPPGPDKILSTRTASANRDVEPKTDSGFLPAFCASDEVVTGGGFQVLPSVNPISAAQFFVNLSGAFHDGGSGWVTGMFNNSTFTVQLVTEATCAKLVPPP